MTGQITAEEAEMLAISALQYLASNEEILSRFLALSGIGVSDIRELAASRGFLGGVLEFLRGDESTLLAFCAANRADPAAVTAACHVLVPPDYDSSV